jgi:prepilin-type N-terminal cleavage/methylation domain-containing protein
MKKNGYTLIEMLVVIAVLLIIFPALFLGIQTLYDMHANTFSKARALANGSEVLRKMLTDIRSGTYGEDGSLPVVQVATTSLTLFSDTQPTGGALRIRYFLDGDSLKRGVIIPDATSHYVEASETVSTILTHLDVPVTQAGLFRYYDAEGILLPATASSTLSVQRIEVTLPLVVKNGRGTTTTTLSSSASIRNLKHVY